MKKREFAAELDSLQEVFDFVGAEAVLAGVDETKLPMLELLLEEIVANICLHAKPEGGNFAIEVKKQVGCIELLFEDDGISFDPLAKQEPDLAAALEDREIGGLGLVLMRKIADSLSYRREQGRNILSARWPKMDIVGGDLNDAG